MRLLRAHSALFAVLCVFAVHGGEDMDIILGYGLILFGATGVVSFVCACFASLVGLGAAPEIWALTRVCGYSFAACAIAAMIYLDYMKDLERERKLGKTHKQKRRRRH